MPLITLTAGKWTAKSSKLLSCCTTASNKNELAVKEVSEEAGEAGEAGAAGAAGVEGVEGAAAFAMCSVIEATSTAKVGKVAAAAAAEGARLELERRNGGVGPVLLHRGRKAATEEVAAVVAEEAVVADDLSLLRHERSKSRIRSRRRSRSRIRSRSRSRSRVVSRGQDHAHDQGLDPLIPPAFHKHGLDPQAEVKRSEVITVWLPKAEVARCLLNRSRSVGQRQDRAHSHTDGLHHPLRTK